MKTVVIFTVLFAVRLFACTGDCLTCHPKLIDTIESDERHKPMLTCITCHKADTDSMSECGDDCFACHSIEKIEEPNIKEHMVIRGCRDCHMELKKEMFETPPEGQSVEKPLKEFLLQ
ncbi:MAG: hypothetical protein B5M52_00055 [Helicobacteraceae bacterium 4484_230]|nr:MAG: hypothetical protein B5M52_00055 [Helicobacteraceae bacterium 4484_230]